MRSNTTFADQQQHAAFHTARARADGANRGPLREHKKTLRDAMTTLRALAALIGLIAFRRCDHKLWAQTYPNRTVTRT